MSVYGAMVEAENWRVGSSQACSYTILISAHAYRFYRHAHYLGLNVQATCKVIAYSHVSALVYNYPYMHGLYDFRL